MNRTTAGASVPGTEQEALRRPLARGLRVTDNGCHVWPGGERFYGECFAHGTLGCCLVAHRSPAAQRAFFQPRCQRCGVFMRALHHFYDELCDECIATAPQAPVAGAEREGPETDPELIERSGRGPVTP